MNNQIVTVNLTPGGSAPAVVRVSQNDVGRPILFKVLDGTGPAAFASGTVAKIQGTKPTGLGFNVTGSISGNTVTVSTTQAMTQEAGMIPTEIRFSITNGYDIGTANFILAVEPETHNSSTTDGTYETMAALEARVAALESEMSGGTGITDEEKALILDLFAKAAYADDDAALSYDELAALWTIITRSVSYSLTHVTSSNTSASVESGEFYTTTLTADTNYTLNTVSVTMGGVDITSTSYSSGTVSIASVTGNIVITATAVLTATSITATYTQSGTVYTTTPLNDLKSDLVVTANYSGGTSETVPSTDYTLSGTLTVGTSTVTVTYAGLTTTFSVTVSEYVTPPLYNWDFKTSLTDTVGNITATTTATQTSGTGIVYTVGNTYTLIEGIESLLGKYVEIDVVSIGTRVSGNHRRLFLFYGSSSSVQAGFICNSGSSWKYYSGSAWDNDAIADAGADYFDGKTVKIAISDTGAITVSRKTIGASDSTYEQVYQSAIGAASSVLSSTTHCTIGWNSASDGLANATISGMRIYGGTS